MGKKFDGISIRQYAISRSVSYETVRRQVTKYSKDLKGHTKRVGNAVMLDEEAQEFLDGHRMQQSVVVEVSGDVEKRIVDELRQQVDELKGQVITLQQEKIKLLEENKTHLLTMKELEESYKPTIFGLYKKVTK